MPVASKKLYRCPKCKKEKSIMQGDAIVSFATCKKCNCVMEILGADESGLFEKIIAYNKVNINVIRK